MPPVGVTAPVKLVSQTSVGTTVATSVNRRVQAMSLDKTLWTWTRRWLTSVASRAVSWRAATWRRSWSDRCSASAALFFSLETWLARAAHDKQQGGEAGHAGPDRHGLAPLLADDGHLGRQEGDAPDALLHLAGQGQADGHRHERLEVGQLRLRQLDLVGAHAGEGSSGLDASAELGLQALHESRHTASAAGDEDAADRRRLGLGQVVVERAADLLDERRRVAGHDRRLPATAGVGRRGIGAALQILGRVDVDAEVVGDGLGDVVAADEQDPDEPRHALLVHHNVRDTAADADDRFGAAVGVEGGRGRVGERANEGKGNHVDRDGGQPGTLEGSDVGADHVALGGGEEDPHALLAVNARR